MIADERLLHVLVTLAANSRFLTGILARAPGVLDELVDLLATDPELGLASFEDIPTATVPTTDDPARILSDYKNLETLRIGLRDLNGTATVRELGADLSRLAEIVVRLAFERARGEVGTSGADLVVFGLGKLGGRELLYGSDLDLVFFCRDDAERGAAAAVAQRLRELLATPTAHGKLYEVDLRLRPGGTGGPLVTTPTGFRDYFNRGLGQCWERMAYTRARAVAGPPTLCEEIQREIEETIYTPGFLASDARAMTAMREKLATARPESLKRARSGGVMDLEFLAQMYVLRRGRDDAQLREGNVGRVLDLLQERAFLQPQRAADLLAAYQFLVALESRIRIVADIHEDRLPEDAEALHTLARRLGYVDTGTAKAEETLREEYEYHRGVAARAFASAVKALGG
jgi:glutamate-ammonia-ligase adenylyltransferase